MNAARYGGWIVNDARGRGAVADAELRGLIGELDRPLMPGFMTAGYSALGRYIFLAAQSRGPQTGGTPTA